MKIYDDDGLDNTLSFIRGKISYVDTVQVLLKRTLNKTQLKQIENVIGQEPNYKKLRGYGYWRRLLLHHPITEELVWLIEKMDPHHLVNRCDVALDLITDTADTAMLVQKYVSGRLIQQHRGKRLVYWVEGTDYWNHPRSWSARNFCVYSNRPSKVTHQPCCHIELRIMRAYACRRDVEAWLPDLVDLDHRDIFKKHLVLREIDPDKLMPQIERKARISNMTFQQVFNMPFRNAGRMKTQGFLDCFATLKNVVFPLDNQWLLPALALK